MKKSFVLRLLGRTALAVAAGNAFAADPTPPPPTAPAAATPAPASTPAPTTAPAPASTPAPPTAPAATSTIPTLAVERMVLDNGLEVLLHEDHRTPYVSVNVWYHVGAFEEQPGKTGFAHLFEHLMFQGSEHVVDDSHFRFLEEVGAVPIQGTTDFDRTNYFETVPKAELELGLWLEADRMGWLMGAMSQKKLDEQRAVVKNERLYRVDNQPYGLAREKLWQALFPPSHPYHGDIIGSLADLDRASLDDVRRFYDDHYAPSNATLTIAGDFDVAQTKKAVERYFGTLPKWPKPKKPNVAAPALTTEVKIEHEEKVGTVPFVQISWLTPASQQPGDLELKVLARVLGDGIASKLQEALIVQSEQASAVAVLQGSLANVSVFTIAVTLRPNVAPEDVLNTVQAQLDYLGDVPVSPEEVTRAVRQIETETLLALELGFLRADILQEGNHFARDPLAYVKDLERLRAMTADSVMAAFKAHLPKDKRAVLIARPAGTPAPQVPPSTETPPAAPAGGAG
jgi:zinc protease